MVRTLNGDNPRPNGFFKALFQTWEVLKEDIMNVFQECRFEGSLKRAFMQLLFSLYLRKQDFHPISLAGGVYKPISKVLVNRLKTVLEKVISRFQNVLIRGRQLLDSVLVTNECLDSKLDQENPVCFVNWT
jgi:hypothetical protein